MKGRPLLLMSVKNEAGAVADILSHTCSKNNVAEFVQGPELHFISAPSAWAIAAAMPMTVEAD